MDARSIVTSVARPLSEMEARDAGSCHDYPSLLRSPSISRRIFHFFTRDAVPFVISFLDFTIFSVKDFESFENCPVIWNGSKLCNEWIFTAVEYVFMKELIVS